MILQEGLNIPPMLRDLRHSQSAIRSRRAVGDRGVCSGSAMSNVNFICELIDHTSKVAIS
jgi:hypothetical protein